MDKLNWASLHCHSSFSLLDGFGSPPAIAAKCKEYGYKAAALTDHGCITGCVDFYKACKTEGIKPILGCEIYVCTDAATEQSSVNKSLTHMVILSKNLQGWNELMQGISDSNRPEHAYYKPRFDYDMIKKHFGNDNHVCITGHPGTQLSECLFTSKESYNCKTAAEAESFLCPDWEERAIIEINRLINIFGNNLYIEIQLIDQVNLPSSTVIAKCLRHIVAKSNGKLKPVATADSHYVNKSDAIYQRILLCSNLGRTLGGVARDMQAGKPVPLGTFFISDNYHIPCLQEMVANHTEEEIYNAFLIGEMCEEYNILSAPQLPEYNCPNGQDQFEYITDLCRQGWKELLVNKKVFKSEQDKEMYVARIKEELQVIKDARLSGYFLIVRDIIQFCKTKGWMTGVGRGSATGCLLSYLIGITGIDPIPYKLLFSRFYNAGRNSADHISLPDIDLDIPSSHRDEIIEYIKGKYGHENVAQMITSNCLMGRSAMKEVLRICSHISFTESNDITEFIPDKAAIADDLETTGETSIIRWALMNRPKKFSKWCTMDEEGKLHGDLAHLFEKAIAIEGTPKSQGKHAAGVIISKVPLHTVCPMVRDKDGNPIAGFEMGPLEDLGQVKFDVLAVSLLDKVSDVIENTDLNINNLEDSDTWDLFGKGDTKGIFQLEKQSRWTKDLKPRSIHHLAALVAIIRPGVADAMLDGKSMTKHYVDRKNGEAFEYFHPALEPILRDSYGVLIYQEQAMRIAVELADFTLNDADTLRKAMGKKKADVMAKVKKQFIEGARNKGIVNEEEAAQIFDWIEKAQKYLFNASHSYSYGLNAFYTAYCKAHRPVKFYEACLNFSDSDVDKQEEIRELINDAKLHDIEVLPPRLNCLRRYFTMEEDKRQIYFGLEHIKDVATKDCEKLFALETDLSILTWMEVLLILGSKVLNKKSFNALASVGALSGINNKTSRNKMIYEYAQWRNLTAREITFIKNNLVKGETLEYHINLLINDFKVASNRLKLLLGYSKLLKNPSYSLEDDPSWIASIEKYYFGISITCGTNDFVFVQDREVTCKELRLAGLNGEIELAVAINGVREHKIKPGKKSEGKIMAFLSIQDSTAEMNSVVIFPDEYAKYKSLLYKDNNVIVKGKAETKKGETSVIVERIFQV